MPLSVVILAAGQGTRMKSSRPKVIHELAGKPILRHVVDAGRALQPAQIIVVIGHGADKVRATMDERELSFVEQSEQLGTGHALRQCLDTIMPGNDVLVLVGDCPLICAETLTGLLSQRDDAAVCVLSFIPENAFGYGRILRAADGNVSAIVEQKDTSPEQAEIRECNSGILWISSVHLHELVNGINNDNAQGEYYLTDVVAIAAARRESPRFARAACMFAIAYLLIGVAQRERAEAVGQVVASERGHAVGSVDAKPAFGSLLLWK